MITGGRAAVSAYDAFGQLAAEVGAALSGAGMAVCWAALRWIWPGAVAGSNMVRSKSAQQFTHLRVTLIRVEKKRNITLSVPGTLLKQVKRLAADQETSISALLVEALARLTEEDRRYSAARRRTLARLQSPGSLGTDGSRGWSRDELHER